MANDGTVWLNFGSFPTTTAQVVITGQAGISSSSLLEAWLMPTNATTEHSVDEQWVENLVITGGNIVPGIGFTIYGKCTWGKTTGNYNIGWIWTQQ